MITERNDPPGLATIAGAVNLTVATGNRITASTLIGVAALFQPGLLIEIDAVVVV